MEGSQVEIPLGLERGIKTFSPLFHSYSQVLEKRGQKKLQKWNGFNDGDAHEGQVQHAGVKVGGAGDACRRAQPEGHFNRFLPKH